MSLVFFFNDTATTEIYTLSLHDALPISVLALGIVAALTGFFLGGLVPATLALLLARQAHREQLAAAGFLTGDRKSTRLNSSHSQISYAVFCLKKKKLLSNSQADHGDVAI